MKLRSTRSFMPALTRTLVLAAGLVGVSTVLGGLKAAFFDQLPFREPENLVTIGGVSHPEPSDYIERFAGRPSLEAVTQLRHGRATWKLIGASRRVDVVLIDHVALDLLGIEVVRGRGFTFADRQAPEAALVSQTFMERALDDSTGTLGQLLEINGRHYTVVGIAAGALIAKPLAATAALVYRHAPPRRFAAAVWTSAVLGHRVCLLVDVSTSWLHWQPLASHD